MITPSYEELHERKSFVGTEFLGEFK